MTRIDQGAGMQLLLEALPDALVISDPEGRIVVVNAQVEALFGYGRAEILGQVVEVLIPERYRAAHPEHRRAYQGNPRTRPMGAGGLALFGRRRDGSEFPAEISLSPLDTEDGPLAITSIRDATERRRDEEARAKLGQVQEALRMRDEFLSVVSHELKTPLAALQIQVDSILRLDRLGRGEPLPPRLGEKLGTIRRATARMNKLINQLLELSRISAGRLAIERERVDLPALVRGVARLFEDEAERAGCQVDLHLGEAVIGRWDPLRVEQIVTNLLSNAIKYGAGKPVEIQVGTTEAGAARLAVRDRGIGIAPEQQHRLFERFERLVSSHCYGGFGLGLWIVRQIIEAHGGSIQVRSVPGEGSTFTVELPQDAELAAIPVVVLAAADRLEQRGGDMGAA
jgi:two-component system, LuxR family, sensor kinase FixL